MTSAMCKGGIHEVCGKSLQLPSGKKFKCECSCHKPVFEELSEADTIAEEEILSGAKRA